MFLHSLILQYIETLEAKNVLENAKYGDIKLEFGDKTFEENRNVELSGLKKEQISNIETALKEMKSLIEKGIKESTVEQLEFLKEKIHFDISRLNKDIEIADLNLHAYNKQTKEYLTQQRYSSATKNASLVAYKYQAYNSLRIKIDLFFDMLDYININIEDKSNVKIKK